jgi:hypothetical protein
VGIDAQLLLEDPERPVSLAVECGGGLVVVEDERLPGGGLVAGQGLS